MAGYYYGERVIGNMRKCDFEGHDFKSYFRCFQLTPAIQSLVTNSGFFPHTNVRSGSIRKNFCPIRKNKCRAHFFKPDTQNIMTVHTAFSTLIRKNFDRKAERSGPGSRFLCVCTCAYIVNMWTMHSPVFTCTNMCRTVREFSAIGATWNSDCLY